MNIPNGVKETTLNNLEFEAGLILKTKYTGGAFDKSLVLCATTGGIRVNIGVVERSIAFDGIKENTAGIKVRQGYTGSVEFATKEVDKEKVMRAIGYATEASGVITFGQGVIPMTEYKDIYVLGKMADGSWRQITMEKTMNTVGLQETRNDKGETEISFNLQANYGLETQDEPPIKIEYITNTQE
jgi:hypothetical protein